MAILTCRAGLQPAFPPIESHAVELPLTICPEYLRQDSPNAVPRPTAESQNSRPIEKVEGKSRPFASNNWPR